MNFLHVSSGELFADILRARGLDPARANPDEAEKAAIAGLATRHLRHAWGYQLWPQLMVVRRVRYREDWDAAAPYIAGDQVWFGGAYWEAMQDAPAVSPPAGGEALAGVPWKRCDSSMLLSIDYDSYGIDELDLGAGVYSLNPDKIEDAQPFDCRRTAYGCAIVRRPGRPVPAEPYVRFRPLPPRLSWTAWTSGATYSLGATCYHAGESWVAVADKPAEEPGTDETAWALMRCPLFFEDYIIAAAAAEYAQDEDGRAPQWARANRLLQELADRYCGQIRDSRKAAARFHR